MSLQDAVLEVFTPGSLLARAVDNFRLRPGQTEMALAVARTIEQGGSLVIEAGTGVGKTFSYLVPALLGGERVLLSTATKTLQDQLFGRDLPRLVETLGLPLRMALLKGRGSYLCWHRLKQARHAPQAQEPAMARGLARIEVWAQQTRSGDLAELPGLDERSPVIPLVTSSRENCLGSSCPDFRDCHVNLARREALAADVVVINHHLFFADLAVRESGMAELLPTVRTVIFDEAHQLNEIGVQFLGRQLSSGQLLDFGRDVLACGLQQARGLVDWSHVIGQLERATRDLRLCLGRHLNGQKLGWTTAAPEGVSFEAWDQALRAVHRTCVEAEVSLAAVSEMSPDLMRLQERARQLTATTEFFTQDCQPGSVRWVDVGHQARLVESPLDIAEAVQTRLLAPAAQEQRSWIFTSATLGNEPTLSWFTEPCGLQQAEIRQVESPFDYPAQAALFVATSLPKPADPLHSEQVAALVGRLVQPLGGRTLVLTTSLRALRTISETLPVYLGADSGIQVLAQGQWPKRELIERFRRAAEPGETGCILVASASFWEGVDIPGEALQMVVIDKLPFPTPGDPLVQARASRLEAAGRNAFTDYYVPEAAVALKQGAGRLIRSEQDRGLLVLCDNRLTSMSYGRRMLTCLPPMPRLQGEDQALAFLQGLTKASTKDLSGS